MYGLNEINIQVMSLTQIFEKIQFKLMMNQITNPDLNKIFRTFSGLDIIIKCIRDREEINPLVKVEYKFDGKIMFYECVEFKSLGL